MSENHYVAPITVKFELGFMETYGSNTLLGKLVTQNPEWKGEVPCEILIQLPVISRTLWRDGPHLSCVPDYFIVEWMKDIAYFLERGYTVNFAEYDAETQKEG